MDRIKEIVEIDKRMGIDSGVFCIQECAELIIEITEYKRSGGKNKDRIFKEAVDVLFTTIVLLEYIGKYDTCKITDLINEIIEKQIQTEVGE